MTQPPLNITAAWLHEQLMAADLQPGDKFIVQRGDAAYYVSIKRCADVPVLGTTPAPPLVDIDLMAEEARKRVCGITDEMRGTSADHLSPADRESARRLNEVLGDGDVTANGAAFSLTLLARMATRFRKASAPSSGARRVRLRPLRG